MNGERIYDLMEKIDVAIERQLFDADETPEKC